MSDIGSDFVIYPKEYEEMKIKQSANSGLEKAPEKNINEPLDLSIPSTSKQEIVLKKKKNISKPQGLDRITRIAKLALLLAKNDSYNENLEIKDEEGKIIPGTDIAQFFRFATQKLRRFENVNGYIKLLTKINQDVSELINNPVVIRLIEMELEKEKKLVEIPKGQEIEETLDETEIVSELENPENPTLPKKNVSRKRQADDLLTSTAPKAIKLEEIIPDDVKNYEWEKDPVLKDDLAQIVKDLGLDNV